MWRQDAGAPPLTSRSAEAPATDMDGNASSGPMPACLFLELVSLLAEHMFATCCGGP